MPFRLLAYPFVFLTALVAAGAATAATELRGSVCPTQALRLGEGAVVHAIRAALGEEPPRARAVASRAVRAMNDQSPRGRQVERQCGATARRKTVIVYYIRRAYLPAQSASQGVAFVARYPGGYRVWDLAH